MPFFSALTWPKAPSGRNGLEAGARRNKPASHLSYCFLIHCIVAIYKKKCYKCSSKGEINSDSTPWEQRTQMEQNYCRLRRWERTSRLSKDTNAPSGTFHVENLVWQGCEHLCKEFQHVLRQLALFLRELLYRFICSS